MDTIDELIGCAAGLLLVGLALLLIGVGVCFAVDTVQERKAFPAIVACEQRQQVPHRKTFSSTVACIPSITRQDTATVKVAR